jgi:hypothetical protein
LARTRNKWRCVFVFKFLSLFVKIFRCLRR